MDRISILGAGWLGLPLGKALIDDGYEVLGSTTRRERIPELEKAGIRPYCFTVGEAIQAGDIQGFFESDILILNIPPGRRRPEVEREHPQQIGQVLEWAKSGKVSRLLFISSTGVYGNLNRVVTEADPPSPSRASGKALAAAEALLLAEDGLQVTLLRLAGLVGGERKAGRWFAGKKDVKNGDAPVNLVHRDDCIGVIRAILEKDAWGETFNLCADKHPTRRAFYTAQAKKEGLEPPTFAEGSPSRFKIVSNQKVKAALGYRLIYPDPMDF